MNHFRLVLLSLGAAMAGFALQGCFTPQPTPECSTFADSYWGQFTQTAATGMCPDLAGMGIALERFAPPGGKSFSIGVRPARLVDMKLGETSLASVDPTNDCSLYDELGDCTVCVYPVDAGMGMTEYEISDGRRVIDGQVINVDDYNYRVDVTNLCEEHEDAVERMDPMDIDGVNITSVASITKFPTGGVCEATNFTNKNEQNFKAIDAGQLDGTFVSFPALSSSYEWTAFKIVNTPEFPGNVFTAHLKYTENGCTAEYDVTGIWPTVECSTDEDCNPNADLDAGRVTGSGISPNLMPVCDVAGRHCVPSPDAGFPR